jgi:glycosyltransferase involved in cell wall biosynthesis
MGKSAELSPTPTPAKIFTNWGSTLFVDPQGHLRHGPAGPDNGNLFLMPDQESAGEFMHFQCTTVEESSRIVIDSNDFQVRFSTSELQPEITYELVALERGLFALRLDGRYLCAEPDGRVTASRDVCSLWEAMLADQEWCASTTYHNDSASIDKNSIRKVVVDPLVRARIGGQVNRKKLLAFGYPRWSHGRVYYDLITRFYTHGYVADILDWQKDHTSYFRSISAFYDTYLTAPDGVKHLMHRYGVPAEKIAVVSHSIFDLHMLVKTHGPGIFSQFGSYAVVSENVFCESLLLGIDRVPDVIAVGIDYSSFDLPPPTELRTVGYASSKSMKVADVEIKRGYIAEKVAESAGLELVSTQGTEKQISFHDMPDFYRGVDALLMTSISEASPLPVMEAAAAGRLVVGTPVGSYPRQVVRGAGLLAPVAERDYISFCSDLFDGYRADLPRFRRDCEHIKKNAEGFDWRYNLDGWLSVVAAIEH